MNYENYVTYYTALFAIQVTLATIIAAGIVAWYQLSDKQVPKRILSKVIKPTALIIYITASVIVVAATGLMAWAVLGNHDFSCNFGLTSFAMNSTVALMYIVLTIALVLNFFYILWQSRDLIDVKRYLQKIVDDMDYDKLSDYLFHQYSYKPFHFVSISVIGRRRTKKQKLEDAQREAAADRTLKNWEERFERTEGTTDPLEPLIEYCRANATTSSPDVERIGLPLLAEVLGKAVADESHDIEYISHYVDGITNDMLEALQASPVMVKKRFMDVIYSVALEFCNKGKHEMMVDVAKKMHLFTRGVENESLKLYAISKLEELVAALKKKTEGAKDWRDVYLPMEGLMMVGARIGENYYHNITELAPVSIIENNNGEVDDVTSALGNFMYRMSELHRKYPDALPIIYFDSLYVISLSLQTAMMRSSAIENDLGLTRMKYEQAVTGSDYTFYDHALTAITAKNEMLLKAAVDNLLKLIGNMSKLGMQSYMLDSIDTLVRLGSHIATNEWARTKTVYGGAAIIDEIVERIVTYSNQRELYERKSSIEHDLFKIQFEDGYADFMQRIGWH